MYVNFWGWFQEYELRAILLGDNHRRRLVTLAREGWDYRKLADADSAIRAFKEGIHLAESLNEPCWAIFHKYWVAEMLFYLKHDYQATLDYTVRIASECRKEIYEKCPVRSRIFFVLANIYYMIDFYGYEEKIVDLLDYIEAEVLMDEDTHLRVLHSRAQIAFDHENYNLAEARTYDMLNRSPFNDFRQRSGYNLLRAIAYARGDIALADDYNELAKDHAKAVQLQRSIAEGMLWESVYLQHMGIAPKAFDVYTSALAYYENYNLKKEVAFHQASSEYMELVGNTEQAIEIRCALVEQVMASASIYNQMHANLSYCRILGRSGKSMDTALITARSVADNSLNPQVYLQKLDAIQAGNYWEYAWQKVK